MLYSDLKLTRFSPFVCILLLWLHSGVSGGDLPESVLYLHPKPDSRFHSMYTNIILKLRDPSAVSIQQLKTLIRAEGENESYRGTTFLSEDNETLIFKPDTYFSRDDNITVTLALSRLHKAEDYSFTFQTISEHAEIPKISEAVSDTIIEPHYVPHLPSDVRMINGVAVPGDFPYLTIHQSGDTEPGLIFFGTAYPGETGNYLIVCQNDGTPYFYYQCLPGTLGSNNFTLQPNGCLSAFIYTVKNLTRKYIVFDSTFTAVDMYEPGHGYDMDGHELMLLENGHALIIGKQTVRLDLHQTVSGARSNVRVTGNILQELDRDKNVIFEWRTWDYFDITDAVHENLKNSSIDCVHMNSVDVDFDGHFIVSSRHLSEITKINRQTGEIIWRLGGGNNQFTFINETVPFSYQHDARAVHGKPNHYLMFDNGVNRMPDYSRAVEYRLDTLNMTAENVWENKALPERHVINMGSAQRLPGGHTLIDWPEDSMQVCEVTPEGNVVFELYSPGHTNYRCRRYPFHGRMQVPYLQLENHGYFVRLFFNKFGDDQVAYYNIYSGESDPPGFLLASTSQTYYDVIRLLNNTTNYFCVTAVDGEGNESGFSETVNTYIQTIDSGENMIKNGSFDSRLAWHLDVTDPANAFGEITEDNKYHIHVDQSGVRPEDIQLFQDQILLMQGKTYVFEFDARADTPGVLDAIIESTRGVHKNYGKIGSSYVTSRENRFQYSFVMEDPTDTEARITFKCGLMNGDIYVDRVSLCYTDNNPTGFTLRINFQPVSVSPPDNYMVDAGERYSPKANGYCYGWLEDANEETEVRGVHDDIRYDTFIRMQKPGTRLWEIELPNGTYSIHLVMGDASRTDQNNSIRVEDIVFQDNDGEDHFDDFMVVADVEDRRLTLSPATLSENLKVNFIEIRLLALKDPDEDTLIPESYALLQNYPNPFNSKTAIQYFLTKKSSVDLSVYHITGQRAANLVHAIQQAGVYSVLFDGSSFESGVYIYRLKSEDGIFNRKMVLVK